MVLVSIKKQEEITNQGHFQSMEEAQAWIAKHEAIKSFGQPREVIVHKNELEPAVFEKQMVMIKEAELDEQGNEISPAEYEEQDVVVKEAVVEITEEVIESDYEIVIEDISAQVEQDKINQEALDYLASTDWLILREMDNGIPCPEDIKAERQAARDRIVR